MCYSIIVNHTAGSNLARVPDRCSIESIMRITLANSTWTWDWEGIAECHSGWRPEAAVPNDDVITRRDKYCEVTFVFAIYGFALNASVTQEGEAEKLST